MRELILDSYAKINLSLDVLEKRSDGYHNIETIFQEVSLRDGLYLKAQEGEEIELSCDNKLLSVDSSNIICKVWQAMKGLCKEDPGVRVHLEKNIPIAAGLAGGSSNAHAMIVGLNDLWNLNLSKEEMKKIGAKIGADVPFFFDGPTAFGVGRGDKLTKLNNFSNRKILLVNNGIGVSTKYVYEHIDSKKDFNVDTKGLVKAVDCGDDEALYGLLKNKMELVTLDLEPSIGQIKDEMMEMGARASLMCGSGPTVFGVFDDEQKLENAFFYFKDKYDLVFCCETR